MTVRTPGEFHLDMGVARQFSFRERLKLTDRAEAFKLLTQANLQAPGTSLTLITNNCRADDLQLAGLRFDHRRAPRGSCTCRDGSTSERSPNWILAWGMVHVE